MYIRRIFSYAVALIALGLLLAVAGCSSSSKVEIPILTQTLPANSPDTPVDLYWSTKSLEAWLQLAANPEKGPDLAGAHINDTHVLWENVEADRAHSKVADLIVSGQINLKHPREWLLLDLGKQARNLGAHGAVVNSLRLSGLTGQPRRDDTEALWTGGTTIKVWVYAQAVRYE
jgi:hypothetical protein